MTYQPEHHINTLAVLFKEMSKRIILLSLLMKWKEYGILRIINDEVRIMGGVCVLMKDQ